MSFVIRYPYIKKKKKPVDYEVYLVANKQLLQIHNVKI